MNGIIIDNVKHVLITDNNYSNVCEQCSLNELCEKSCEGLCVHLFNADDHSFFKII